MFKKYRVLHWIWFWVAMTFFTGFIIGIAPNLFDLDTMGGIMGYAFLAGLLVLLLSWIVEFCIKIIWRTKDRRIIKSSSKEVSINN